MSYLSNRDKYATIMVIILAWALINVSIILYNFDYKVTGLSIGIPFSIVALFSIGLFARIESIQRTSNNDSML